MSKDQGPKAARRFTKRFARPGYTDRQGYLAADLLWRNGTRDIDFTKRTLHTFVF